MKNLSNKACNVSESSTLAIAAKAKVLIASGEDLIAFTSGEPDFDTPQHIKDAAVNALHDGFTKYTASTGILALRQAICDKLYRDNGLYYEPAQIVVQNGAKQALSSVFEAIINDGDEIIVPAPYWLTYPQLIRLYGGIPRFIMTDRTTQYKPSIAQFESVLCEKTKAIVLNSPNNPSGAIYTKNELEAIAEYAVKHDLYIISDEIYEKLIYNNTPHISIASLSAEMLERTIVINGYSKSHAMTGWRVGYSASNNQLASVIGNLVSHQTSNVNSIAQKAALAAQTGDQDGIAAMCAAYKARAALIYSLVQEIDSFNALYPESAFYVFVDITQCIGKSYHGVIIKDAAAFADCLLDAKKVAIIPCADFGYPNHIRLSFSTGDAQIIEGMKRISAFVSELQ